MADNREFSFAGISAINGKYGLRMSNNPEYHKFLHRTGHDDIRMVVLETPMTKIQAIEVLKSQPAFQDQIAMDTFEDYLNRDVKPQANVTKSKTGRSVEFVFIGVSIPPEKQEYKVTFSNDPRIAQMMYRANHTNIIFAKLSEPMNKVDAINEIKDLPEFSLEEIQTVLNKTQTSFEKKTNAFVMVEVNVKKPKLEQEPNPIDEFNDYIDDEFDDYIEHVDELELA